MIRIAESRVWDALVSGDAEADARLLTYDFLGVSSTGFAEKHEYVGQLTADPVAEFYALSDARLRFLCHGVVLLVYRVQWMRVNATPATAQESMYITSIWKQEEGAWRNIFSQDTNAES